MWKTFVETILSALESMGYWGIMIGLMIEVIPSELVLAYGGFLVSKGAIGFAGAVLFGTIGGTLAQLFLYWIGLYGGRPFVDKYGKYLLIDKKHVQMAERWFARYGVGIVFTARFIPIVRHAISIPAGLAGMPLATFVSLTVLAVLPWSIFFITIGYKLGDNWRELEEQSRTWLLPATVAAIVLTLIYLIWNSRRQRKRRIATSLRDKVAPHQVAAPHRKSAQSRPAVANRPLAYRFRLGRCVLALDRMRVHAADVIVSAGGVLIVDAIGWRQALDVPAHLWRIEYAVRHLLEREGLAAPRVVVAAAPDSFAAPVETRGIYGDEDTVVEALSQFAPNRYAAWRLAECLRPDAQTDAQANTKTHAQTDQLDPAAQEQIYRLLTENAEPTQT